ncbi:MAG: hypothetical protein ACW991_10240, partial [Candidatus Hodarchaeales archaeon]
NEDQKIIKTETNQSETASGYSPFRSYYISLQREWNPGDRIDLNFPMKIQILRSHPKVKNDFGKSAITRGPIVYCLENIDNPNIDIFNSRIIGKTLHVEPTERFGAVNIIEGKTDDGLKVVFIPYYYWGNRGHSQMTVMVNTF